eukprot:403348125
MREKPRVKQDFQQTRFKVNKIPTEIDLKPKDFEVLKKLLPVISNSDNMRLLLDTTSSWLIVARSGCENCAGKTFDPTLSKSFIELEKDPDNLVPGIDGILGLSREYVSISRSSGPLFVKSLKTDGKIYESIYALSIADDQNYSYIDIGTYQLEDDLMPVIWFKNQSYSLYWQAHMNAYMIGRFPGQMYKNITKYILTNHTFYTFDKYILTSCNVSAFPSIYLRLDDFWFEIKPESYILNETLNTTNDQYKNLCTLAILPSSDVIILGVPFLRNYYTIFDLENDQVGFYQSSYIKAKYFAGPQPQQIKLPASNNQQNPNPTQQEEQESWFSTKLLNIVLLTLMILLVLGFMVWYFFVYLKNQSSVFQDQQLTIVNLEQ